VSRTIKTNAENSRAFGDNSDKRCWFCNSFPQKPIQSMLFLERTRAVGSAADLTDEGQEVDLFYPLPSPSPLCVQNINISHKSFSERCSAGLKIDPRMTAFGNSICRKSDCLSTTRRANWKSLWRLMQQLCFDALTFSILSEIRRGRFTPSLI
jgi:hypothetical protein